MQYIFNNNTHTYSEHFRQKLKSMCEDVCLYVKTDTCDTCRDSYGVTHNFPCLYEEWENKW